MTVLATGFPDITDESSTTFAYKKGKRLIPPAKKVFDSISPSLFGRSSQGGGGGEEGSELWHVAEDDELFQV